MVACNRYGFKYYGCQLLWPLNTIYMKEELNKSLTIAGVVLLINSLGMVVGNLLGGVLFDKLGGYKTILIGTFTCLFSTTLLNLFHGWPWYAVWLVLLGIWWRYDYPCNLCYGWSSLAEWGQTNI